MQTRLHAINNKKEIGEDSHYFHIKYARMFDIELNQNKKIERKHAIGWKISDQTDGQTSRPDSWRQFWELTQKTITQSRSYNTATER